MKPQKIESEERVLVLAPVGRDGALTCKLLTEEGISSSECRDMEELCRESVGGAGAALLTEEVMSPTGVQRLLLTLESQAPWSDLPLIFFTGSKESARFFLETIGPRLNLTILERPINIAIALSTVRSALRARRRQYQMRDLLVEMENANRTKDEFLATVSHELRTPLNAILGWATIATTRKFDQNTLNRALQIIERNARSQAQLIEDLLDVSRIITGKLRLERGPVDLISVITSAMDSVHPASEGKEIEMRILLDPSASRILGDATRLQQVVWNLLSNAVKFTPRGGTVLVKLDRTQSMARITVSDSGPGIGAEFLPHVFDRFQQADGTSTRRYGGLGLGLAIVRHLAEMHGGTAQAHSAGEGQGATFTVELPILSQGAAETYNETASREQKDPSRVGVSRYLVGLRILAVDDEADTRDMLKTVLECYGAEVRLAASAREGFETLQSWNPDVLVCDLGMPEEDGYSLIRRVRAWEPGHRDQTPAVALTGYVRVEERIKSLQAGFQMFVPKPVEVNELASVIASLVDRISPDAKAAESCIK